MSNIDIVFTAYPGPGNECVFVEVERDGFSIRHGKWVDLDNGLVALRIPDQSDEITRLRAEVERLRVERDEIIEQCAEVCDEIEGIIGSPYSERAVTANACAAAIRAMKEQP